MNRMSRDMSPLVDLTRRRAVGPERTAHPVYVDLLPPCNAACPAGENIQAWLDLAQAGRYRQAWETLVRDNPMPAIHGRVCYHPCETACNRGELDAAVGVHAVERFLGDRADAEGWTFGVAAAPSGKRVLVIGAGPAGLSAAYHLARLGHAVEIHEAAPVAGGMMHYGIPAYRLPRDVLAREVARIAAAGVRIVVNHKVADVRREMTDGRFDAAFLAIGADAGKHVEIPARDAARVLDAVSLLHDLSAGAPPDSSGTPSRDSSGTPSRDSSGTPSRDPGAPSPDLGSRAPSPDLGSRAPPPDLGSRAPPRDSSHAAPLLGRRVVVYGGGNTAMDAARTAKRLGAEDALIVYRRDRAHMPAHQFEADEAIEEGVRIKWLTTITEIVGPTLTVEMMALDARGRPTPTGRFETLSADAVVLALGQTTESDFLRNVPGVAFGPDGTVVVDATLMTGHAGLFAGGDAIAGERSVTISVGHGKHAARHIDAWLRGTRYRRPDKAPIVSFGMLRLPVYADAEPSAQRSLDVAARMGGFEEVLSGLTEAEARHEARRCLSCGNCFECDNCFAACPTQAIVRLGPTLGYRIELDRCTGCAVCVEQCPCHAMEMVADGAEPGR